MARGAAALACSLIAVAALAGPGAAERSATPAAPGPVATGLGPSEGWSPARMEAAPPLDALEAPGSIDAATAATARRRTVPYTSRKLTNTTAYPNRVHGRLFGTFDGLGDYSCSATVVTSRSGSLITTAGHCVYDAGLTGSNQFASALTFVPGYRNGSTPFGEWDATNAVTTRPWVRRANLDFDSGFIRVERHAGRTLQSVVGSRGIGFNQPRKQKLAAYGYPARPTPPYDGEELVRCKSRYTPDPARHSSNPSVGMGCDMQQGSSGGGWVSQGSFVVSSVSHGHTDFDDETFFGPHYGDEIAQLYRFKASGFPSFGPIGCAGHRATIVGTDRGEAIHGTGKKDVIATVGGNDRVRSGAGRDIICLGPGDDSADTGKGRDRIDGGTGGDTCDGGGGRDRSQNCETRRHFP